jgi:hypothetical protein
VDEVQLRRFEAARACWREFDAAVRPHGKTLEQAQRRQRDLQRWLSMWWAPMKPVVTPRLDLRTTGPGAERSAPSDPGSRPERAQGRRGGQGCRAGSPRGQALVATILRQALGLARVGSRLGDRGQDALTGSDGGSADRARNPAHIWDGASGNAHGYARGLRLRDPKRKIQRLSWIFIGVRIRGNVTTGQGPRSS